MKQSAVKYVLPMKATVCHLCLVLPVCLAALCGRAESALPARELVQSRLAQECPGLLDLYKHLHSHPELSFQEVRSAARVAESCFEYLDAPISRLGMPDAHNAYAPTLEDWLLPNADKVVEAARKVLAY